MTLALAWVGTRSDEREDLYFLSDSRTRGGMLLDMTPKILTLPRSDCAICFAGDTAATFPLMLQISAAIAAHSPAQSRNMDIGELKDHLLRVCTDIANSIIGKPVPLEPSDVQFIFGGFSWRARAFRIWTIYYETNSKQFRSRPATTFHQRLSKAVFIGDWATKFRGQLTRELNNNKDDGLVNFEPLFLTSRLLKEADPASTIGGAPQLVRVSAHMNTRPFCVTWGTDGIRHLFGRPLFDYENCDYWAIDPDTGKIEAPRHFKFDRGESPR